MKMRLFLLSFIAVCFLSACSKDDDNTPEVNFGSKNEINAKIQKIWEPSAGVYNYFEFTPFAWSKATRTSVVPDGDYKVILADGSMVTGSYIINDDLKTILLSELGTLLIKELDDKNFSFTLTLTDNKTVDVSTTPSTTASLAAMYVIKSMRDDLKNNSSLVRIDLATGKETTIIESIKWLEYIKYNATTNEIIGISDDNENATDDTDEYFLCTLNLTTKKMTTKSLGTSSGILYDDFVLAGGKIYAMKSIEREQGNDDRKHQIVEITPSTGQETVFMDSTEWYEYMEYNPLTREIIGITESNVLHLINFDTKKITKKNLDKAKDYKYNDFILRETKIYAHKLFSVSGSGNDDSKYQIVEIELSTGKETVFIDNALWSEYLGYNPTTNELIGLNDEGDTESLDKTNLTTKKNISKEIGDAKSSYDDFIIIP